MICATTEGRVFRGIRNGARRGALVLGLVLPLAGCLGAQDGVLNLRATEALRPGGSTTVSFYRGEVVVRAPRGYCVDPGSVQRGGSSRFALLTSCAHLKSDAAHLVPASVITVSVLPRDPATPQPRAQEMAAAAGGDVLNAVDGDGISLVQMARGGSDVIAGGAPEHWRAALVINQHLVGLAVYSRSDGAATGPAGRDTLIDLAEQMREASPVRLPRGAPDVMSAPAPQAGPQTGPQTDPQTDPGSPAQSAQNEGQSPPVAAPQRGLRSILSGLFQNPA